MIRSPVKLFFCPEKNRPLKFYLTSHVPKDISELILTFGGELTSAPSQADIRLTDPNFKNHKTPHFYSYELVKDSVAAERLLPKSNYVIPVQRTKGRIEFSREDDQVLKEYLQNETGFLSGNKIYEEIAKKYPHHTHHSWRTRALSVVLPDLQRLRNLPASKVEESPVSTEFPVAKRHKLSQPSSDSVEVVIELQPKKRMESKEFHSDDDEFPKIVHATYPLPKGETLVTFKKQVELPTETVLESVEPINNENSLKKTSVVFLDNTSVEKPFIEICADISSETCDKDSSGPQFLETTETFLEDSSATISFETSDNPLEDSSATISFESSDTPLEESSTSMFIQTSDTRLEDSSAPMFLETSNAQLDESSKPMFLETSNPQLEESSKPMFLETSDIRLEDSSAPIFLETSNPLLEDSSAPMFLETFDTHMDDSSTPLFSETSDPHSEESSAPMLLKTSDTRLEEISTPVSIEVSGDSLENQPALVSREIPFGQIIIEPPNRESFHFLDEADLPADDRYSVDLQDSQVDDEEENARFHTPELEFSEFDLEENQEKTPKSGEQTKPQRESTPSQHISDEHSFISETPTINMSDRQAPLTPSNEDREEFATLLAQLFEDFENRFPKKDILKALNMCSGRFPATRALLNANMKPEKMLQSLREWVFTQDEDDALLGLDPFTKKYVENIHGPLMTEARIAFLQAKNT